LIIANVLAEQL